MAFSAAAQWTVRADGSDTNGGGFDAGGCTFSSDLAATSGNTDSPVVTSATYTFVAGDAGHYLYVDAGTNWIAGWYRIVSVAGGAATLDAAVGKVVLKGGCGQNNTVGCATVAAPSSGSWSVDYSRGASPAITYDGAVNSLTIDGTTNTKATASPAFTANLIGNVINVTAGTGFTVQRVQARSIAAGAVTFDKALGTLGSTGGTGKLGGALATTTTVAAVHVSGNTIWLQNGTYSRTTTFSLQGGGSTTPTTLRGWDTVLGVTPAAANRPTITAGAGYIVLVTWGSAYTAIADVIVDATGQSGVTGISGNAGFALRCKAINCATGISMAGTVVACETSGCASGITGCYQAIDCRVSSPAGATGITLANNGVAVRCVVSGGTLGIWVTQNALAAHCTVYSAGKGYQLPTANSGVIVSCVAVDCTTNGIAGGSSSYALISKYASYNNVSDYPTDVLTMADFVALSGDPFVDAAGGDFRPDGTAGQGAALRGAALGVVGQTDTPDIGGVEHADAAAPTYPDAKYVYDGIDRGDGTTGTLHASNISAAAGAGSDLAAGILKSGEVVDDVAGTYVPAGGGRMSVGI